ncbi:hypothetical protein [uncultured Bosea sp.]|uniref:hypothetical protein n=1 Tax=uncultured Bosea sp. TaxID=211457 RepID=UPI0025E7DD27|nr:hypothetical protein [uncultured Bosea sp.]
MSNVQPDFCFEISATTAPDRVTPQPSESLRGLLARFATANGVAEHVVLQATGATKLLAPGAKDQDDAVTALADLCGLPRAEIARRAYTSLPGEGEREFCNFRGLPFRTRLLTSHVRAVSPAALRISPIHRAEWDIVAINASAETGEVLLTECPNCKSTLGWSYPSIVHCAECQIDLRDAKADAVVRDETVLANIKLAAALVDADPSTRERAIQCFAPDLASFGPGEIISLAALFGAVSMESAGTDSLRRELSHRKRESWTPEFLSSGMSTLLDWPNGFFQLVEAMRSRPVTSTYSDKTREMLGPLADLIEPWRVGETRAAYFQSLLRRHLDAVPDEEVARYPLAVIQRWSTRICSLQTVLKLRKTAYDRFKRIIDHPGIVVAGGGGTGELSLVNKELALQVIDESRDLLTVTSLKSQERVSDATIEALEQGDVLVAATDVARRLAGIEELAWRQSAWDATKRDLEARLAPDPDRKSIRLCDALSIAGRRRLTSLADIFSGIQAGSIRLRALVPDATSIGARLVIDYEDAKELIDNLASATPYSEIGAEAVAIELRISFEHLRELVRAGIISAQERPDDPDVRYSRKYIIQRGDIDRFHSEYVFVKFLATKLGMVTRTLKGLLTDIGVELIEIGYAPLFAKRGELNEKLGPRGLAIDGERDPGITLLNRPFAESDREEILRILNAKVIRFGPSADAEPLRRQAAASRQAREKRRLLAVADLIDGAPLDEAAHRYGVAANSLYIFSLRYRRGGLAALVAAERPPREVAVITAEQRAAIVRRAREMVDDVSSKKGGWRIDDLQAFAKSVCGHRVGQGKLRIMLTEAGFRWKSASGVIVRDSYNKVFPQIRTDIPADTLSKYKTARSLERKRFDIAAQLIQGIPLNDVLNGMKTTRKAVKLLINDFNRDGIDGLRLYANKAVLNPGQRRSVHDFAQTLIMANASGTGTYNQTDVVNYISENFGADYSVQSIGTMLKGLGLKWVEGASRK